MRKISVLALMLVTLTFVAPAASTSNVTCTLTVVNNLGRDIQRIHLAWSGTERWGPDRLGKDILRAGRSIPLGDIAPGDYDILFIDTQGNQCVVRNLPIYNDRDFKLTDQNCQRKG